MSSKKPLSFEEKRQRTLDFFTTTADFFQLKELEKMLPKQKGIVMQSVKEVVQSLVDDRLVCAEKIGTSNYFWCFPSTAMQTRKVLKEKLEGELAASEKAAAENQAAIDAAKANLKESDGRTADLQRLAHLEEQVKRQQADLAKYAESDPEVYADLVRQEVALKASVNAWVDNIYILQKHCSDRFNIGRADFFEQFGIPEELDYVS